MSPLQELGGDVGWALHVSEQAILLSRIEAAADHAAEQKKRKMKTMILMTILMWYALIENMQCY